MQWYQMSYGDSAHLAQVGVLVQTAVTCAAVSPSFIYRSLL